jgi:hypothetical protein
MKKEAMPISWSEGRRPSRAWLGLGFVVVIDMGLDALVFSFSISRRRERGAGPPPDAAGVLFVASDASSCPSNIAAIEPSVSKTARALRSPQPYQTRTPPGSLSRMVGNSIPTSASLKGTETAFIANGGCARNVYHALR